MTRLSIFASLCLLLSGCGLWVDNFVPEEPGFDAALPDAGGVDVGAPDVGVDASRWDGGSCSRNEDCAVLNTGCTEGVCVGSACVAEPKVDGTVCVDGASCTDAGMCMSGACIAPARDCTDLNSVCAMGACDLAMNMCLPTPINTGGNCNDEDLCSWDDVCGGVSCQGVITDCGVRADVLQRETTDTPGNLLTGSEFRDECPRGQVMIGVRAGVSTGFYAGILTRFSTLCGEVRVDRAGALSIADGAVIPSAPRGTWAFADAPTDAQCPSGQVVVGFGGALERVVGSPSDVPPFVGQLQLRCAPLAITGDIDTGFTVSLEAVTAAAPTVGSSLGERIGVVDCPAETLAMGSRGRHGEILDAFGLVCGEVQLTVVTTAPQAGLTHAADTVFRDDCPWGTVPVGVVAGVTAPDVSAIYDRALTRFQTLCAPFRVGPSGETWAVTIDAPLPTSAQAWGTLPFAGVNRSEARCGVGEVLVGYEAVASGAVTQLIVQCAAPVVSGPVAGAPTFSFGPVTARTPIGTRVDGTRVGPYVCPSGMLGRGFFGSAADVVNSIALRCARPSFMIR